MPDLNIDSFKSQLTNDAARPNLFKVILPFPSVAAAGDAVRRAEFMIKSAPIPTSAAEAISVPIRGGRTIKLPGDRGDFEDVELTIINQTDWVIRNAFERWLNAINAHKANIQATGSVESLMTDFEVVQLSREGRELARYKFVGSFPTTLSSIDLSFDSTGEIEEFSVTMAIQYWERAGITS